MKLDKLILVNWGSLRSDEYAMGNMTLLTGPTGSGKSTLLDALQTVMTAAHQNIYSYNPGQDETTQTSRSSKSKRTLWSYIVGAEDNLFARPDGAHGYIAGVFKPDAREEDGKAFTALIGAAARVDGSGQRRQAVQERLALLLIDDAALRLDDLVDYDLNGNMLVVEVEKIENHLKRRYAHVLNLRDTKREYLCQLYGRFRGVRSVSFAEAESAAKAWSQAIAHKPIGGVDELVKTQILEYDSQNLPQRISQISELMRQVHQLRLEGDRLKYNIGRLEHIEKAIVQANSAYETAVQYQLAHAQRALRDDQAQMQQVKETLAELGKKIQLQTARIETLARDKKSYHDSQIQLAARLSGIAAAEQKRRITERLDAARQEAKAIVSDLQQSLKLAERLQSSAQHIIGMDFPASKRELSEAAALLAEVMAAVGQTPCKQLAEQLQPCSDPASADAQAVASTVQTLQGLNTGFEKLHQALSGTQHSFVAAVHSQLGQLERKLDEAQAEERRLAERKANLAEGGADYPREISTALKLCRAEWPSARIQVLCDLIEPKDPSWQSAIEGYIAGARFNFVVDEAWEARVIEFIRQKHLRAKVVQGSFCKRNAKPERMPKDSIVHELHAEHPIAYAYLVEQYGSVVKVQDVEQLRFTPRGVMKDGKAAGSRTLFTGDADALVFGKEAQRLAREKVVEAHAKAEQNLQALKAESAQLKGLLGLLGDAQQPSFDSAGKLLQTVHDSQAALADLSRLDLEEVDKLEAEKQALDERIAELESQANQANRLVGQYQEGERQQQRRLAALEQGLAERQQHAETCLQPLQWICSVNQAQSLAALQQAVDAIVATPTISNQSLQDKHSKKLIEATAAYGTIHEAIADYNQHARSYEQLPLQQSHEFSAGDFAGHYRQLIQLHEQLRRQLQEQREIGFVKNLDKLRTAEASFKDVFTKQFCYEIRNAVDQGVKTLKILNHELQRLKFGTDRFQLDWSVWVPEFKDYYDFFCAAYDLSESQDSGDLFDTPDLSDEQCKVRDRLVGLLLNEDREQALKELQRIADYRNYRRYEIWKDSDSGSRVALSEWGTGSGGQLETPAYIVRAAVVTNRLKHFEKGSNLKLLVNDESFAKMDERRAHDVIRFLRDSLDMQLICAMPTKHAGAIKTEFTKEWSFTRTEAEGNGEVDFISEADERDLRPDKLRELWECRRRQIREQARIEFEAVE